MPGDAAPPGDEDLRLLSALATGRDPGPAMGELLALHEAFAFRLAHHLTGHHADAAEVVSDAFVRVWQSARDDRFDPAVIRERGLRPWLSRVVTNLVHTAWRARSRRARHEDRAAHLRSVPPAPDRDAAAAEQLERAREALAALPPRQQQAFVLTVFEQWPAADVADALETTPGMVRKLVYQARQALRTALGESG